MGRFFFFLMSLDRLPMTSALPFVTKHLFYNLFQYFSRSSFQAQSSVAPEIHVYYLIQMGPKVVISIFWARFLPGSKFLLGFQTVVSSCIFWVLGMNCSEPRSQGDQFLCVKQESNIAHLILESGQLETINKYLATKLTNQNETAIIDV